MQILSCLLAIGYIINSKKYQSKLDWVGNLSKKVFLPQEKKTSKIINLYKDFGLYCKILRCCKRYFSQNKLGLRLSLS